MCGRYGITADATAIAERFGAAPEDAARLPAPTYNAAPGHTLCVVRPAPGTERRITALPWGITGRPNRASSKAWQRLINARAETADAKPTFREAFRRRRCLIPADGFYEWSRAAGPRHSPPVPYLFRLGDPSLFGFAGLWFDVPDQATGTAGFVILTCAANSLVARLHHRMPVILRPHHEALWLDPSSRIDQLTACLAPYAADAMTMVPVSPQLNRTSWDGPECYQPHAVNYP